MSNGVIRQQMDELRQLILAHAGNEPDKHSGHAEWWLRRENLRAELQLRTSQLRAGQL
jgi:hypothetical protein